MRTRHLIKAVAAIAVLGAFGAHAADLEALAVAGKRLAPDAALSVSFSESRSAQQDLQPWIHHSMPECLRDKVEIAFEIATRRVREVPECAELFRPFLADGLELLAATLYFPAGLYSQTTRCRHSFAITLVGGQTTWVCRKAAFHSDERMAMALIHEALHHAGLAEYPQQPTAMLSGEINNLVMRSCDLR